MSLSHDKKVSASTNTLVKASNVDLTKYPLVKDEKHPANKNNQVTIGDMHGNTIKFLYFLIYQNVLELKNADKDYQELRAIVNKSNNEVTKQDIKRFKEILHNAKVNPVGTVRLIGDELADRNGNDYLTLEIFAMLAKNNVHVETILSNHSMEFFQRYESVCNEMKAVNVKDEKNYKNSLCMLYPTGLGFGQGKSLTSLMLLLTSDLKPIHWDDVKNLVENIYKPCMRVLSYTHDADKTRITIYTHAAAGLFRTKAEENKIPLIKSLAEKFNISYQDETVTALANTIDKINAAFYQKHVLTNEISTVYKNIKDVEVENSSEGTEPFIYITWSRNIDKLVRPNVHPVHGYGLEFVHGHDKGDKTEANIYNLDNDLGKKGTTGEYFILFSNQIPSQLKLKPPVNRTEFSILMEGFGNKNISWFGSALRYFEKDQSSKRKCDAEDNRDRKKLKA